MSSSGHDDERSPERPARNPAGAGAGAGGPTQARRVKKKRVRNFTEDDRAAHRIFEKSRREAFKEALTNLANLLPALTDTEPQRLSKHVVVDESITFIKSQHEQIRTATEQLEAVKAERDQLLAEVNHWRSGAGIEPRQANILNHPTVQAVQAVQTVQTVHHADTSAASEAILGTLPAALQPADPSSIHIVAEAAPPFLSTPIHEPNPPPLPTTSNAGMSWDSFESRIHSYGPHPDHMQSESGHTAISSSSSAQIATYPTPQPPSIPHFNMDQAQHEPVFLPFQPPQPFNPQNFPASTYIPSPNNPLPDYMPP